MLMKCATHCSVTLWSGKPNPHSDANNKYITAQTELHHPPTPLHNATRYLGCTTSGGAVQFPSRQTQPGCNVDSYSDVDSNSVCCVE